MPLFATLFAGVMGAFASFLAQFVTRKLAVVTAAVAALAAITGGLLLAFNTLVSPLAQQMFSTEYGQFLGLAFPPVAGTCLAAIASAWAACALYGWQLKALSISVQA